MMDSEEALLQAAVSGDEEAMVSLLELFGPIVRQRLHGRIDKKWQSVLSDDDVMQETYAEALLSISRFEPKGDGSFVRWLATIAKNNLLDAVKGLQSAKRGAGKIQAASQSADNSHWQLLESLGASTTSPSQRAARNEAKELLNNAVEQLPDTYKQVVMLYDLEEHSAQQVGELLECSAGAVYMRRSRAHAMLKELLGNGSRL